jgi:hypothetical protein
VRQLCCKSNSCLNIKFYKTHVLIYYYHLFTILLFSLITCHSLRPEPTTRILTFSLNIFDLLLKIPAPISIYFLSILLPVFYFLYLPLLFFFVVFYASQDLLLTLFHFSPVVLSGFNQHLCLVHDLFPFTSSPFTFLPNLPLPTIH